jgi:hypothetical protein
MYGASTNVLTREIIPEKLIRTEWGDPVTHVDYIFTALTADITYVVIKNYGFQLSGDELIETIKDSTGGFTTVLDGLKAYLEHGISLNLVADKFPDKLLQVKNG